MRKCIRVIALSLLGLLSTAVLGALTAMMAAVSLAATTALIVPGTGTPDANTVGQYMENFRDYYMQDTPCTTENGCGEYNPDEPREGGLLGINYYASFWPIPLPGWCDPGRCEKFDDSVDDGVTNLRNALLGIQELDPDYGGDIVIAGYSQGARVVTIAKMQFANGDWDELLEQVDSVSFVFIGNPNRPNGGILSRFGALGHIPILDVTTGQPTPTGTPDYPRDFPTEDWAIRWEGIADFPQYLLNPLAVANSLLGFYYDHGTYLAINRDSDPGELPAGYDPETWKAITSNPERYPDIVEIQKYGDTTYYTITPKVLPLVRPLHSIPFIGKPIADLIEPALRVIIEETGYNRNIPYGQPTEIGLIPNINPVTLMSKLIPAFFVGVNNFLANFGLATEIPLSPTTPVPEMSPITDQQEDEPELAILARNVLDGSSNVKLALVQGNGDPEQQLIRKDAGDDKTVVDAETADDPTLPEGNGTAVVEDDKTPVVEDVTESEGLQATDLGQSPTGNVEVVKQDGQETIEGGGKAVVVADESEGKKEPEGNTAPAQNRLDANSRSASLNFSTNNPAQRLARNGNDTRQSDPTVKTESDESLEGTKDPSNPSGPTSLGGPNSPSSAKSPSGVSGSNGSSTDDANAADNPADAKDTAPAAA